MYLDAFLQPARRLGQQGRRHGPEEECDPDETEKQGGVAPVPAYQVLTQIRRRARYVRGVSPGHEMNAITLQYPPIQESEIARKAISSVKE